MDKQVRLTIVKPVYVTKQELYEEEYDEPTIPDQDVLTDVHKKLVKIETSVSFGHKIFAVVVAAGASWCAWLTNLLINKI